MGRAPETDFWGNALVAWPKDVVAKMGLPAEDAAYLCEIGLPSGIEWNLEVVAPSVGLESPVTHEGFPVIAYDGPVPICADPGAEGRVFAMEGGQRRAVNSSVRRFGAFLMLYQDYRMRVRDLDDEETAPLIDEIEKEMRALDPGFMAQPEGYWPVIVEQMRDGFL